MKQGSRDRSESRKKVNFFLAVLATLSFTFNSSPAFAELLSISTVDDLLELNDVTKSNLDYKLMNELDLSDVDLAGRNMYITTPFSGTLDGNGLKIFGLTRPLFIEITSNDQEDIARVNDLFLETHPDGLSGQGVLASSIGSNTLIDNVHVAGSILSDTYGNINVGGLAGSLASEYYEVNSQIQNSSSTVDVNGIDNVGGLVGLNGTNGTITASFSAGTVSANDGHPFFASYNTGGLVGFNAGKIQSSYALGNVYGEDYVGGLVGNYDALSNPESKIKNSYASGDVTGNSGVGGLIGHMVGGEVSDSFASGTVAGYVNVGGLLGVLETNLGVFDSVATGAVYGQQNINNLVGFNWVPATINETFGYGATFTFSDSGPIDAVPNAPQILAVINANNSDEPMEFQQIDCVNNGLPFLQVHRNVHVSNCPPVEVDIPPSTDNSAEETVIDLIPNGVEFDRLRVQLLELGVEVKFLESILPAKGFISNLFETSETGFSFLSSETSDVEGVHLVSISENANEELSFQKDDVIQLQVKGEKGAQVALWTTTPNGDEIFLGTITYSDSGIAVLPAMKFSSAGIFALSLRSLEQTPALKTDSTSDLATIKFVIS